MHARCRIALVAGLAFIGQTVIIPAKADPLTAADYAVQVGDYGDSTQSGGTGNGATYPGATILSNVYTLPTGTTYSEGAQINAFTSGISAYAGATLGASAGNIGALSLAGATEDFSIQVVGPTGIIPLIITGSGSVSVTGDGRYDDVAASLHISQPAGVIAQGCAGLSSVCSNSVALATSFDISGTYDVVANQPIGIDMYAFTEYLGGYGGGVTAMVDPTFAIDPSFGNADQYTLIYSPGLVPSPADVPEPASLVMLSMGIAALGVIRHLMTAHSLGLERRFVKGTPLYLRGGIAALFLALSLASGSPANAQDALGGLTLGVFLSKALDQIEQAITDAQNAGNAVEIGAGREGALAIQNVQNAYADSLNKTTAQLDATVLITVSQIKSLTNDIATKADITINNATARVQQIANSLPFANKEPQVTSVSPSYVVPKDASVSNDLEINFLGNFPNSSLEGYAPSLKVGGRIYQAHNTTQKLTFLVPQGSLFSKTAQQAGRIQFGNVSLILPWQADRFFGLLNVRREDHFDILIGSLPASPGTITVLHTVTGTIPVFKDFCGDNIHQASTREAGSNDQKDVHHLVTAESGWHVVRGTSRAEMGSVQGDVGLPSAVSDDGDRVVYTATTIHHGPGHSGSMDFSICFKETQDQTTSHAASQPVALKWGDSKSFDYTTGTWEVNFVDFTGRSSDFRAPDNHNPFLIVDEPSGKLSIRVHDPDKLNWP